MDIGAATAQVFAGYGARVIVSDINTEAGGQTVEAIRVTGGTARFVACDVGDDV